MAVISPILMSGWVLKLCMEPGGFIFTAEIVDPQLYYVSASSGTIMWNVEMMME